MSLLKKAKMYFINAATAHKYTVARNETSVEELDDRIIKDINEMIDNGYFSTYFFDICDYESRWEYEDFINSYKKQ